MQGFVYVIHAVGTNRVKIGFTQRIAERLSDLQTGSPFPLELVGYHNASLGFEQRLHEQLKDRRCIGEWFEIEPQEALSIVLQAAQREADQEISIYDVPGANLDARGEAYTLLKHPDETVRAAAQRIIDLLSRSIRAMGREDVAVLQETQTEQTEVA